MESKIFDRERFEQEIDDLRRQVQSGGEVVKNLDSIQRRFRELESLYSRWKQSLVSLENKTSYIIQGLSEEISLANRQRTEIADEYNDISEKLNRWKSETERYLWSLLGVNKEDTQRKFMMVSRQVDDERHKVSKLEKEIRRILQGIDSNYTNLAQKNRKVEQKLSHYRFQLWFCISLLYLSIGVCVFLYDRFVGIPFF
jgi:chromosome segregation ATPase